MLDIDTLWDFSDPAGTEQKFLALLAETQTQLARTHSLRKNFDEAHRLLDAVEAELFDGPSRVGVRLSLERGRCFRSAGEREKARPFFTQAHAEALAITDDFLAVDALHMLALVADGDEAIARNEEAIAFAGRSDDPKARRWRASLANNLGWALHESGRFHDALARFEEALVARGELNQPEEIRIARWCVARCLRSLGRPGEALEIQRAILSEAEDDGFIHEELAENLLALGDSSSACPFFASAAALLERDDSVSPERLARLKALGTPPAGQGSGGNP